MHGKAEEIKGRQQVKQADGKQRQNNCKLYEFWRWEVRVNVFLSSNESDPTQWHLNNSGQWPKAVQPKVMLPEAHGD